MIDLKGVHKVTIRKGGVTRIYHYAWRGGPRITAEPDTPEFIEQFQALTRGGSASTAGTFQELITAYQQTTDFTRLRPSTKTEYTRYIRMIETEFGDMPIKALNDPTVRGDFLDWRDRLSKDGARKADYAMAVASSILSWAFDRRKIVAHPLERHGKLHKVSRVDIVWKPQQQAAFLAATPSQLRLPFLQALHTGQRQGDILRLTWNRYDGERITLRQSKRGAAISVRVTGELKAALDATPRLGLTMCLTSRGQPWTSSGFRASWRKACAEAGVEGVTFHDLRGTAVTRLAFAGCTVPEICGVTGHSLKEATTILDRFYLSSGGLADSAIAKIEKHQKRTASVKSSVKRSATKRSEKPESD